MFEVSRTGSKSMNERMKALAVEADFMLCEDGHFYSEGQSQKITDGLQKFAELIVKECARVQHKRFCEHGDVSWDILMQHFGVKE
jgi:hypothetical protein